MAFEFSVDDALDLATVGAPQANDDGSAVGFLRTQGGDTDLVAVDVPVLDSTDTSLEAGAATESVSTDHDDVSAFDWRPGHPEEAAVVADGALYRFDTRDGTLTTIVDGPEDCTSPAWSPDGSKLAYVEAGLVWFYDLEAGGHRALNTDGPPVAELFGPTPVRWNPDGSAVATLVDDDDDVLGVAVFEPGAEDSLRWSYLPEVTDGVVVSAFDWVGDDQLVYAEDATDGSERIYRVTRMDDDGHGTALLSEGDEPVLARDRPVGTDDGRFAVLSGRTGFHHVYVVDVDRRLDAVDHERPGFEGGGVVQVSRGEYEARGDANDAPAWSDDGSRLGFVTNEHDPGERHLRIVSLEDGAVEPVVEFDGISGNAVHPTWLDGETVAFVRSGRTTPADIHVADVNRGTVRRLSAAHPRPSVFDDFPEPEPVGFAGRGDLELRGYRYAPPDAEAGDDRPAVVWAHGGPIRQMRRGFHHMRSYAGFHAFNHLLVSRGYVVLALNYRGGIGYGRTFEHGLQGAIGEDDVDDCLRAAAFLRDDPRVGDRVGLWGLSYGGFLANAVATKTDAFEAAVNFAGIWDWRDWVRWAAEGHRGAGRLFAARFGGHPDTDDETVRKRYATASPCEFADGLDVPLFALHGSGDPNVPFDQMDGLVSDLVDLGVDFELAYYPDEDHMFAEPETWRDALGRVLPFLDAHLAA
jgi:dipeptidyl aminopeptidase/acylaminoacyl peptidase